MAAPIRAAWWSDKRLSRYSAGGAAIARASSYLLGGSMKKIVALICLVFSAAFLSAACNFGIGVVEQNCDPGGECVCNGIGSCTLTCTGPGCAFTCSGTGACEFHCPQGGCTATITG